MSPNAVLDQARVDAEVDRGVAEHLGEGDGERLAGLVGDGPPAWFARVPAAEVVAVDGAKRLWVGESYVRIVMNDVRRVNPAALVPPETTLPVSWTPP